MARSALRILLASSLAASPLAVSLRVAPAAKAAAAPSNATEKLVPAESRQALHARMVEVPMVVVVVEDGGDMAADGAGESDPFAVNRTCIEEMQALSSDRAKFEQSHQCESKTGYSASAVAALKEAKPDGALGFVEKTFHECAGLSAGCAKQVAPGVVTKMRLSGVAISDNCKAVAQSQQAPKENSEECRMNMSQGMVASLQKSDIDGAMSAAQHGLHVCQKIEAPCDFQLAPIVVMQLIQQSAQQEQQQIQEVLFSGLRNAEEMSRKMELSNFSPVSQRTTRQKAEGLYAPTAKNQPKQVSLLGLNFHMRISARRATNKKSL